MPVSNGGSGCYTALPIFYVSNLERYADDQTQWFAMI